MWKEQAFLVVAQRTALLILPSQSLQLAEPFLASPVLLDLGKRTLAKSEMCHEASG